MDDREEILMKVTASPASDGWGFVGIVVVGDHEAYRTIRTYNAPAEALSATQLLLANALGGLMAGQEWASSQTEFGHSPRRTELEFGLGAKASEDVTGHQTDHPGES